jgi:outer membrane protein assembly factor BamB
VLSRRRTRAERLYREGVRFNEKGDTIGAQRSLRGAAVFKGYKAALLAARKLDDIASERERVAGLLEREKLLRQQDKLDEAFKTIVEIADRFPRSADRLNLRLEVSIETVPSGARVFLNKKEFGRSPITIRIPPRQSGALQLKKPGFVTLKKKFERARERVMRFHLQKQIAYRASLEQAVFSAATLGRPDDDRVRPLLLVQAGTDLVALAADTGTKLWQVEPGAPPAKRVGPAVLDETIFVLASDRLRSYSLTGSARLDIPVGGTAATRPVPVQLRLLANRTFVVLACADGSVMSFDVSSRERRWTGRVNPPVNFDFVVNEKAVFVPSSGEGILALGILDGRPIWTAPIPGEAGGDIAMDPKGELLGVVTSLGEAYAISAADGQVKMRVPLDRARGGAMVLTEDTAFIGTDDGRLRAVNIVEGIVNWSVAVEGAIRAAPTLHGGNIYVGTEAGRIVCVNAQSGRIEWSFDAEAPITASGTICEDMIVFGTHEGEMIGIKVGLRTR